MRARLSAIAREERGFSLITVMMLLLVISAFSAAAYGMTQNDIPLSAQDQHRNAAYSAAEAGIDYYLFHLNQDNAYWTHCDNVPGPGGGDPNPVVQEWDGTGVDTRAGHWRNLPNGGGQYSIELLHTPSYASCLESDQLSMFNQSTGTFRIRSTGQVDGQRRSIVASFRHRGFLDFLYFTDVETIDPVANPVNADCTVYRRNGRSSLCSVISFVDRDNIHGPFHTNDDLMICGSPTIGRPASELPAGVKPDDIEISGGAPNYSPAAGYQATNGCAATPNFSKPPVTGADTLALPPSNSALASVADPAYTFTGRTIIKLNAVGNTMTVNGGAAIPQPANGVIFVKAGATCGQSYDGTPTYTEDVGCPIVYVQGSYAKSLTIGSEGDIVVTGNLTRSGNAELGLIPMNFARVFHPVGSNCGANLTAGSAYAPLPGVNVPAWGANTTFEVDAAILSLHHSWIVDNWACGAPLGTLKVVGAIAQEFRGPVGTFSGNSVSSGYIKAYYYDDALKYVSPPYFLDPIQSSWRVSQLSEQLPAR